MTVTNEQAAYMAGALDGEGHIGLRRQASDPAVGRQSPKFQFVITVANTNKQWLETLASWFGGHVYKMNEASETLRVSYSLRFRAAESRALLTTVMPYLLMKRRQAELILRYFEIAVRRRESNLPGRRVPSDLIAEQEAIHSEIRSLNLSKKKPIDQSWRKAEAVCSVSECGRKHYGKGYCWKHYRKYIIRGGPAIYEKKCVVCGRDFVARRSDGESCSKACADKKYYREVRVVKETT